MLLFIELLIMRVDWIFFSVDRRIQSQYDHLEQEYRQTCIEVLRNSNTRGCGKVTFDHSAWNWSYSIQFNFNQGSRSQPAIGLRQTPKPRVSPAVCLFVS